MKKMIKESILKHKQVLELLDDVFQDKIEQVGRIFVETLKNGNKIMFCGNGGSAADAQHLAAEISGRFETERPGLAGMALTTDTSVITSISNDFGYERVFARQVQALARPGDLVVGISTSGNSENVLQAFKQALDSGCRILGFSGRDGGKFNSICEINLQVAEQSTARIQEMHILIGHILCAAVDAAFKDA